VFLHTTPEGFHRDWLTVPYYNFVALPPIFSNICYKQSYQKSDKVQLKYIERTVSFKTYKLFTQVKTKHTLFNQTKLKSIRLNLTEKFMMRPRWYTVGK